MKVVLTILGLLVAVHCYGYNLSVFKVQDLEESYSATAFVLRTAKGPVTITNKHVCDKQTVLIAEVPGKGRRIILARRTYAKHDLCVLSPVYGIPTLELANEYDKNQPVIVEGYPLGVRSLSTGLLMGHIKKPGLFQIFVIYQGSVTFGSSGSPVVDSQGKVTGVISMVNGESGKYGYAVPLEYIKDFLGIN